jgi:hypothetical protein
VRTVPESVAFAKLKLFVALFFKNRRLVANAAGRANRISPVACLTRVIDSMPTKKKILHLITQENISEPVAQR